MWKTPHLQKKSVKNPASPKVKCEPLGLPGGDLVYHIFEPHITWKLNFFPKLKKFPNASIRANMRFVKTRFVRRILAISRVLEFFARIWWGSNSHRLLPYHSRRPLHYHTWWSSVVFTYYVLLLFFYLNPLITCDFSGQICSFPKSGKFGPNVTGIRTLTSPLEANGHLHYTTFTDDRYLGGIRHILIPWFSHKCVLK